MIKSDWASFGRLITSIPTLGRDRLSLFCEGCDRICSINRLHLTIGDRISSLLCLCQSGIVTLFYPSVMVGFWVSPSGSHAIVAVAWDSRSQQNPCHSGTIVTTRNPGRIAPIAVKTVEKR
ncbi:hypothetical protein [Spirulina major]|uniref:hypothetical protein n=1 Tax=Spirulina major TaxID=270636 RepID=UPI00158752FD|nr:hypothetical protein [Spirulina major]